MRRTGNYTLQQRVCKKKTLILFLSVQSTFPEKFQNLTPETGTHQVTLSPDGAHFIDQYSQPNIAPVSLVKKTGWYESNGFGKGKLNSFGSYRLKAPTPVKLKAGDGVTDVYGLLQPSNIVAGKKYPIIDYIYPGPQGGSVGSWAFTASKGDNNALLELGAYVLVLEEPAIHIVQNLIMI